MNTSPIFKLYSLNKSKNLVASTLVFTCLSFAACGKNSTSNNTAQQSTETPTQNTPAPTPTLADASGYWVILNPYASSTYYVASSGSWFYLNSAAFSNTYYRTSYSFWNFPYSSPNTWAFPYQSFTPSASAGFFGLRFYAGIRAHAGVGVGFNNGLNCGSQNYYNTAFGMGYTPNFWSPQINGCTPYVGGYSGFRTHAHFGIRFNLNLGLGLGLRLGCSKDSLTPCTAAAMDVEAPKGTAVEASPSANDAKTLEKQMVLIDKNQMAFVPAKDGKPTENSNEEQLAAHRINQEQAYVRTAMVDADLHALKPIVMGGAYAGEWILKSTDVAKSKSFKSGNLTINQNGNVSHVIDNTITNLGELAAIALNSRQNKSITVLKNSGVEAFNSQAVFGMHSYGIQEFRVDNNQLTVIVSLNDDVVELKYESK